MANSCSSLGLRCWCSFCGSKTRQMSFLQTKQGSCLVMMSLVSSPRALSQYIKGSGWSTKSFSLHLFFSKCFCAEAQGQRLNNLSSYCSVEEGKYWQCKSPDRRTGTVAFCSLSVVKGRDNLCLVKCGSSFLRVCSRIAVIWASGRPMWKTLSLKVLT